MRVEAVWELLRGPGLEHLILQEADGVDADGLAAGILEDAAYRIQYHIRCDAAWNVQQFTVRSLLDNEGVTLQRRGDEWWDDQARIKAELRGCTEVDIMVTPFTNTLPIRRLGLQTGQSVQISAVYIRVPDLAVSRAEQVYTALEMKPGGGIVRYQSLTTGFTADLKVDADGLVTDYPAIFRMLWRRPNA